VNIKSPNYSPPLPNGLQFGLSIINLGLSIINLGSSPNAGGHPNI